MSFVLTRARAGSSWPAAALLLVAAGCGDDLKPRGPTGPGSTTGGTRNPTCEAGSSAGEVQAPEFVRNLEGQTSWYAAPIVHDLDGDGSRELIAAYYSLFVFDSQG